MNNLKAERTLTAVTDERLKSLIAHEGRVVGAYELRSIMLELQTLRSQSLSTQQPMGEPVLWRMKDYADGWIFVRTREAAEAAAANGNLIQPLYALHPNQESGE